MSRTSSRGVLWDVVAPVVRWPLHSPARLVLVVVGVLSGMCLLGSIGDGADEPPETSVSASSSTSSGTSPSSSTSEEEPSSSSSSDEERTDQDHGTESPEELRARAKAAGPAVRVASTLATDVQKHRKSAEKVWWKKIEPSLSENGKKQLRGMSPTGVGFTKVTGTPRMLVTEVDMGPRYVSVGVPTDQGTYLFLVERTGKRWGVASVSKLVGSSSVES